MSADSIRFSGFEPYKGIALFGLKEKDLIGFNRHAAPVVEMEKHTVVETLHVTSVGSFRGDR